MVGDLKCLPENLPALWDSRPGSGVVAEVTSTVSRALSMLQSGGYDAAVLWIERDDELSAVLRIRNVQPDLPIVVLSPRMDGSFTDLAQRAGATRTACSSRHPDIVSEEILRAVTSGELVGELRSQAGRMGSRARELRELTQETHSLTMQARSLLPYRPSTFVTLIVEDDQNMVLLLRRAFLKAQLPEPAAVLNTGEALIRLLTESTDDFLTGRRPFPIGRAHV